MPTPTIVPIPALYERLPRIDWRTSDRRETAISIIRLLERSANGNGGSSPVFDYFMEDCSWWSFTPREQRIIATTDRAFTCSLCAADFMLSCGRPRRSCRRKG